MISQQENFSIENTLEGLLNVEPENKFYQSLQKQYHERKTLTPRQVECLQEDYKEKINSTPAPFIPATPTQTTNNVAPATAGKRVILEQCEQCILKHPHMGPHKYPTTPTPKTSNSPTQTEEKKSAPAETTEKIICAPQHPPEKMENVTQACDRCGTKDKKAKISESCDNHAGQWVGKLLCWKCYVDTHVDAYLKEYLCPDCREKITEWAGTYDNWCNMKCKNGHVTNVNFLIKVKAKKTAEAESKGTDCCKQEEDGASPTPETIKQQPSLEDFIQNLLSSPDYGTRKKIMDQETIKAIIGLIKEHMVRDCSHYHGYDSKVEQEAKYEKTTLTFENNQLYKNGTPLDCNLDDPQFNGMRINSHGRDSISILLDFYHPQEGYSKKCVNFDIRLEGICKDILNKNVIADENTKDSKETVMKNIETPKQTITLSIEDFGGRKHDE